MAIFKKSLVRALSLFFVGLFSVACVGSVCGMEDAGSKIQRVANESEGWRISHLKRKIKFSEKMIEEFLQNMKQSMKIWSKEIGREFDGIINGQFATSEDYCSEVVKIVNSEEEDLKTVGPADQAQVANMILHGDKVGILDALKLSVEDVEDYSRRLQRDAARLRELKDLP